jgi:fumarate reductase flavoprotein subunit
MSDDLDFLVIGAGACGLSAAIAAADAGLSVAIAEKTDKPGGNSALSTGSIPGAGTRFQREAGIDDDPESYCRDLMAIAGETENPQLVRRLTATSAETVEWLVDVARVRLKLITDYRHIGHSVPRLHAPPSRRGSDFVDDLVRAVERRDIPLAVGNAVRRLISEEGRVFGAILDSGDGKNIEIRARSVLLAVNGFGASRPLVEQYCPEIGGAQYFGARGSEGEAVYWGRELGAQLENMAAYQGYAAVADPHGSILTWTTIEKGGILLGENSRRFGNESLGYSGFAKEVLAQGKYAYAIFDQRIFEIAAKEEEFVELHLHGGLKRADSVAEVADSMGLRGAAAVSAVEAYNLAAAGQTDDEFGRNQFGLAPLKPPFYACRVVPALFHTQGGLRVDDDARVMHRDGHPIPGLFAGGGAACGISGRYGALGYASGNGLLTAVALGRLAGLAAARDHNLTAR